ncbi:hypothetical protein Tco_0032966, partial [Tanacetum coccineum]
LSCLLKEQLLEPALNLTVHCCGLELRVLNGYDHKSFDEERGLNRCEQTSLNIEERGLKCYFQQTPFDEDFIFCETILALAYIALLFYGILRPYSVQRHEDLTLRGSRYEQCHLSYKFFSGTEMTHALGD